MLSVASKIMLSVGLQDVVSVVCDNKARVVVTVSVAVVVFADVAGCCHHCRH